MAVVAGAATAVAVRRSSGRSPGTASFLVFASLAATLPFFLPMAIGVIAGDSVAGEASAGTLRYLLVAPAGRTRLLLAKFTTTVLFAFAATLVVAVSALAVGALLFPVGEVTLISGTTVSFGEGLLRALAIAGVVALSLTGLAALGCSSRRSPTAGSRRWPRRWGC